MSENRELTMDDYVAMLRRRLKVILVPALIAPLSGFMASYALPPRYSSTSTVLVESQKVPDAYVAPVITSDFAQRVQTLSQEILNPSRLRPVIASLKSVKPDEVGKVVNDVQQNMKVEPVITSMAEAVANSPAAKVRKPTAEPVPGFNVIYVDSNAARAQEICNALTSLIVDENLRSRSEVATSTTEFLSRQLDDAKADVDRHDKDLADFKQKHMGELPSDVDNNMHMLLSLNSQLDATTQTLSRAQQDKTYAESMLAQQIAAWKSSLSSANPQTLQQELTQLQAQLMQLQARYTDDYPDVSKTKADIAEVEKKLKEINVAAANPTASDASVNSSASSEPIEIRQLRLQVHQYQTVIEQATLDQKRLQNAITVYQARTSMSPGIEEQYKVLTRDNDTAQAFYKDLLAKKSSAGLGLGMETAQEGEQMKIAVLGALPKEPSFPVRPLLAAGGFGVGLAFGALIAMILEVSDKSIRTEKDASSVLDLPALISVPWLGEDGYGDAAANGNGNGTARRRFWGRSDSAPPKDHEHVEV